MLKIRLMRIGAKKRPFYRVIVVDERNKRNGAYIENVGTYDPMTTPHDIKLKQDRIDDWIKKGAQLSDGFLKIIGKAAQKNPRKPKKEKAAPKEVAPAPAEPTDTAVEETQDVIPAEAGIQETIDPVGDSHVPSESGMTSEEETPAAEEATPETTETEQIAAEPEAPRNDETENK